jgi:hypothetical protein
MRICKKTLFGTLVALCTVLLRVDTAAQQGSELAFRDEFTGTSLRPEWSIIAEDRDRWALIEGDHLIIISSLASKEGDINNILT